MPGVFTLEERYVCFRDYVIGYAEIENICRALGIMKNMESIPYDLY